MNLRKRVDESIKEEAKLKKGREGRNGEGKVTLTGWSDNGTGRSDTSAIFAIGAFNAAVKGVESGAEMLRGGPFGELRGVHRQINIRRLFRGKGGKQLRLMP